MTKERFSGKSLPVCLLVVAALLAGCGGSLYRKGVAASGRGDYDTALDLLYESARQDPDDYLAWREIGLAWYRSGDMGRAEEAFATSNRIRPNALSNLYLGLIFEKEGDIDKAIRVYGAAARLRGDSREKKLIDERMGVLIDRRLAQEARLAVAEEDSLAARALPENTIAVIDFDDTSLPDDLKPMAVGLAEFIAMDLAKVKKLRVLERLKIDVILDELHMSSSSYSDAATAPRVGRLLGSSRIVLGTVTPAGEEGFRVDGKLVATEDGSVSGRQTGQGQLDRFFEVEKSYVFGLIDSLGITLSREERDAIEEVPTESFLAFMAYSEGLFYKRRGMYGDAARAFDSASGYDPGFGPAAAMSAQMQHAANYGDGSSAPPDGFEADVASPLQAVESGLGGIQAANILNSGFIMTGDLYWDLGTLPVAPPGGGPVWNGHGIIIIRGDLDAR